MARAVAIVLSALVLAPAGAERGSLGVSGSELACRWRTAPTTDPHAPFDRFKSVTAISSRKAWAVGEFFSGHEGGANGSFVERWDGRRWRVVAAPIPAGGILSSVSASEADDVWSAGGTNAGGQLIEHWDGTRWRVVRSPRFRSVLSGVTALAPDDVWAVGIRHPSRGGETLIEHWNGTRWGVVASPNPPRAAPADRSYATLTSVTAISGGDVWAAGYSGAAYPVAPTRTLIEHWNGRRWRIVSSPNIRAVSGITNDILSSISGIRSNDVWAVGSWSDAATGYGGRGDHALALHWDGRRWSRIATPAIAERSLFAGVAAGSGYAWAVGNRGLQPRQRTLVERWDGVRWSLVPAPAGFGFAAVSLGGSARTAWAVGARGRRPLAARC